MPTGEERRARGTRRRERLEDDLRERLADKNIFSFRTKNIQNETRVRSFRRLRRRGRPVLDPRLPRVLRGRGSLRARTGCLSRKPRRRNRLCYLLYLPAAVTVRSRRRLGHSAFGFAVGALGGRRRKTRTILLSSSHPPGLAMFTASALSAEPTPRMTFDPATPGSVTGRNFGVSSSRSNVWQASGGSTRRPPSLRRSWSRPTCAARASRANGAGAGVSNARGASISTSLAAKAATAATLDAADTLGVPGWTGGAACGVPRLLGVSARDAFCASAFGVASTLDAADAKVSPTAGLAEMSAEGDTKPCGSFRACRARSGGRLGELSVAQEDGVPKSRSDGRPALATPKSGDALPSSRSTSDSAEPGTRNAEGISPGVLKHIVLGFARWLYRACRLRQRSQRVVSEVVAFV